MISKQIDHEVLQDFIPQSLPRILNVDVFEAFLKHHNTALQYCMSSSHSGMHVKECWKSVDHTVIMVYQKEPGRPSKE